MGKGPVQADGTVNAVGQLPSGSTYPTARVEGTALLGKAESANGCHYDLKMRKQ